MSHDTETKTYEIKINEKELSSLIEKYFKEKLNKTVTFSTESKTEYEGYFLEEREIIKTSYYLHQEIQIVGLKKQAKIELLEKDIKDILKKIFTQYEVTSISFKSGYEYSTPYEFKSPTLEEVTIRFKAKIEEMDKGEENEDWSLRRKF